MPSPITIEELCARVRAGETFSYRHFYGHTARADGRLSNAVFSQFYPCQFSMDGVQYRWAEQWMMAEKARLFGDMESLSNILSSTTARDCKRIGRDVANYDDEKWNAVRFDLVVKGNVAKFHQNETLMNYLFSTGDDILVEAAPDDRIWGNGLRRNDPNADNPLSWPGLNLLGFALVRARALLRGE